jgi:NADP-dependent 3-hydroxy acid dehydrogenase YdfG
MAEAAIRHFDRIDLLVNNAGVYFGFATAFIAQRKPTSWQVAPSDSNP